MCRSLLNSYQDDNGNYIFTDRKFFNLIESISQVKEVNISLTFQYNPRDETFQEYVEDFRYYGKNL